LYSKSYQGQKANPIRQIERMTCLTRRRRPAGE
jgi:hypothetical protein